MRGGDQDGPGRGAAQRTHVDPLIVDRDRNPDGAGGVGVVEAVLIGGLVAAGGVRAQVTAAVLVYRVLTWALPILVGVVCYLWWRRRSIAHPEAAPSAAGVEAP